MESKSRHGCVTTWLILMIIANAGISAIYIFLGDTVSETSPVPIPETMIILLATIGIANMIFAVMLLQWKKWAFWGFAGTSLLTFGINMALELGTGSSLLGLTGVAILYGVLQIKSEGVSAWDYLE